MKICYCKGDRRLLKEKKKKDFGVKSIMTLQRIQIFGSEFEEWFSLHAPKKLPVTSNIALNAKTNW